MRAATVPRGGARADVRRMAIEVLGDLDHQAAAMARAIHAGIPELSDDMLSLTAGSCRVNVGLICGLLREEQDLATASAPVEALMYAREWAHLGLPMDSLIRTYRIGHAEFWRFLLQRLNEQISDPVALGGAVAYASDACFQYVDALSSQISAAYLEERELWSRSAEARRSEVVREVLEGRTTDVDEASQRLRYELRRQHVAFVVSSSDERTTKDACAIEELAHGIAEELGARELLAVPNGPGSLACWVAFRGGTVSPLTTATAMRPHLHVAFGEPLDGLDGFRQSHRQALDARRVAVLTDRRSGVTRYEDAALVSMLTNDIDAAKRFVRRELGSLADDTDAARRLTTTLRAFFEEGCSFKRTSRRLGVHGNTVVYRVRRAAEMIGHETTERQLEVRVALQLVDVLCRRSGGAGVEAATGAELSAA